MAGWSPGRRDRSPRETVAGGQVAALAALDGALAQQLVVCGGGVVDHAWDGLRGAADAETSRAAASALARDRAEILPIGPGVAIF